ncbi:response regulator transcription factor [Streptomyces sp. NPDC090994]|uniref:helix-turn-helix transcriptional regulator n=1 Tax=Streptomyces sp. NPDC090994 TaxID=3365969 RepID=UPI00381AA441
MNGVHVVGEAGGNGDAATGCLSDRSEAGPRHGGPAPHAIALVEPNEVIRFGLLAMLWAMSVSQVITVTQVGDPCDTLAAGHADTVLVSSDLPEDDLERIQAWAAGARSRVLLLLHDTLDPRLGRLVQRFPEGIVPLQGLTSERLGSVLRLHRGAEAATPPPAGAAVPAARRPTRRAHRSAEGRLSSLWHRNPLTQREIDVLGLLSQGLSNKQIAPRLGISEHGVKRHISNILAKLNCSNRTEAVSYALQQNFLGASRVMD